MKKNIIILGDSFVLGNTTSEETFPFHLNKIIQSDHKQFQVLNAGISGHGTDQEYLFFVKNILPRIKPQILIWNVNENDVYDNIDRPLFDLKNNKLEKIPAWKSGFYLNAIFLSYLPDYFKNQSRAVNLISTNLSRLRLFHITEKDKTAWSIKKINYEINEMQKLSKLNGFKLIIAISPNKAIADDLPAKYKGLNNINEIKKTLKDVEIIDQNEYFINFKSSTQKSENNTELFLNEKDEFPIEAWHPNSFGNYLMARSLMDQISGYLD